MNYLFNTFYILSKSKKNDPHLSRISFFNLFLSVHKEAFYHCHLMDVWGKITGKPYLNEVIKQSLNAVLKSS